MDSNYSSKSKGFSWGIGAATLMCIFTVMFLTVFAVLSFMTAETEVKNSDKYSQSVTDYYMADSAASYFYASILNALDLSDTIDEVSEKIRSLDFTDLDSFSMEYSGENGLTVYARTNIQNNTGRNINLEFFIDSDTMTASVIKWKAYSASEIDWEADESLELWIPDF